MGENQGGAPSSGEPTRPGIDRQERTWGMLCHLSAFAGFVVPWVGSVLGPLVVWLVKKEEFTFVDDQGKESLNFQITMLICGVVSGVLAIAGVGVMLAVAVAVYDIVMVIVASTRANEGSRYRYPLAIRLIT